MIISETALHIHAGKTHQRQIPSAEKRGPLLTLALGQVIGSSARRCPENMGQKHRVTCAAPLSPARRGAPCPVGLWGALVRAQGGWTMMAARTVGRKATRGLRRRSAGQPLRKPNGAAGPDPRAGALTQGGRPRPCPTGAPCCSFPLKADRREFSEK